jgi:hypothetical protein
VAALGAAADFGLAPDAPDAERRRELAAWLTEGAKGLLARVMVNRLWHHHFGAGIVDTPNDFGFSGGRPTHAELLDHLADRFMREGWSLKRLHRLIVTSATYRQASLPVAAAASLDADNRLLWRKSPQRLEAEAARDALLLVAGQLNPAMGGPGYHDFRAFIHKTTQFYEPLAALGADVQRRTVYRTWARGGRNPLLDTLDCADPSTTTPRRGVTTTPLQALALWNNTFVLRMAALLAQRVEREAGGERERQIERLYELAFARPPAGEELVAGAKFVAAHGLTAYCRVLINSNEFLYID